MAGPQSQSFKPGVSDTLTATASTSRVELDFGGSFPPYQVRVVIDGTGDAFISFGDSTVTASATDLFMLTGTAEVFTVPPSTTYIAAISNDSNGCAVYITAGNGM